jgi:hypothetical protein
LCEGFEWERWSGIRFQKSRHEIKTGITEKVILFIEAAQQEDFSGNARGVKNILTLTKPKDATAIELKA